MKIDNLKYGAHHDELATKRDGLAAKLSKIFTDRITLAQSSEPEIIDTVDRDTVNRAAELLGQAPLPIPQSKRDKLAAMATEERALRAAINMLDGQIAHERKNAEVAYRNGVAPDHRKKMMALVDAMRGVHTAALDLQSLTYAVEDQGVSMASLGAFSQSLLGSPTDPYSAMARFFREAVDMGIIAKSEMPKELHY